MKHNQKKYCISQRDRLFVMPIKSQKIEFIIKSQPSKIESPNFP